MGSHARTHRECHRSKSHFTDEVPGVFIPIWSTLSFGLLSLSKMVAQTLSGSKTVASATAQWVSFYTLFDAYYKCQV